MTTKELLKKEIDSLPESLAKNMYKLLVSLKKTDMRKKNGGVRKRETSKKEDETEYLLKSPANKKKLLQAMDNVIRGKNLIEVSLKDLK